MVQSAVQTAAPFLCTRVRRLAIGETRTHEPRKGPPAFKSIHPHASPTHSHASAINPSIMQGGKTQRFMDFWARVAPKCNLGHRLGRTDLQVSRIPPKWPKNLPLFPRSSQRPNSWFQAPKRAQSWKIASPLNPQARQNVVLELGYFVGLLGRKHVCALCKGGVELPSDYDGVAWINMDSDWRLLMPWSP